MVALEFNPVPEASMGIDRGVLYFGNNPGIVWDGLLLVEEQSQNIDTKPRWLDGVPYTYDRDRPSFKLNVEAIHYPVEFGSNVFNFSYRENGNIHLVYNATAIPEGHSYTSTTNTPDVEPFKWTFQTRPNDILNMAPAAHLYADSSRSSPAAFAYLLGLLYGTATTPPRMPAVEELIPFFEEEGIFIVLDHGDGTWTASGPPEMIEMLNPTMFQIISPSAIYISPTSYTLESTG